MERTTYGHTAAVGLDWSLSDLLRGAYEAFDHGDVILSLVVLRRHDAAVGEQLAATSNGNSPPRSTQPPLTARSTTAVNDDMKPNTNIGQRFLDDPPHAAIVKQWRPRSTYRRAAEQHRTPKLPFKGAKHASERHS